MIEDDLKRIDIAASNKIAEGKDVGHTALINDLQELLMEAENCEFHDFLNNKYALPKVMLHNKFMELDEKVKTGEYDN